MHEDTLVFNENELRTLLENELNTYNNATNKLQEVKARKPENQYRETLQKRDIEKLEKTIENIKKSMEATVQTALYNTKNNEAGVQLNIPDSVKANLQKVLA